MLTATIDTGTTNTRVCIWKDACVLTESAVPIGVRDTAMSGSTSRLKAGVAQALAMAADQCGASISDLGRILASGMISSNAGLVEIPHVPAPAGIAELAHAMQEVTIPEIAAQPLWFIPGVRNRPSSDALPDHEAIDFMRGEEVESVALADRLGLAGPLLFVLPGSHNKFVLLDPQQRIAQCMTTLSGELVSALTTCTVLASTLDGAFVQTLQADWLLKGARLTLSQGLTRAAFSVRALGLYAGADRQQCANFLLGAVMADDVVALREGLLKRLPADAPVIVAGNELLSAAFLAVSQAFLDLAGRVRGVPSALSRHLAGHGALRVAQARGLL